MTLVELVVVLGVIGVLIGLLLPAVQAARESARRLTCSKNLGQLTLATLAFESVNGGLPSSWNSGRPYRSDDGTVGVFSPQVLLLRYLDQSNLFNSINFNSPTNSLEFLEDYNGTAANQLVAAFLCPSDPGSRSARPAKNSYRACIGLGGTTKSADGYRVNHDGVFTVAYTYSSGFFNSAVCPLSAVTDGLSNTLAFSEKPIGSDTEAAGSPFRDWYFRPLDDETLTPDQWRGACSRLVSEKLQIGAGSTWIIPGAVYTHFYAADAPNSSIPDCGMAGIDNGLGIYTARSYHPGGVNATMADGSVRWFSSTTQVRLWQSLGTRAGGEEVKGQ